MLTIAVDAMGGDHAPSPEVEGAITRRQRARARVILVGDGRRGPARTREARWRTQDLPIEIVHATERITMEDSGEGGAHQAGQLHARLRAAGARGPGARVRVRRQHRRVHGHREDGAGRGAGRRPSRAFRRFSHRVKERPWWWWMWARMWIATPQMLAQFARDGRDLFAPHSAVPKPRVGLLSIGEEEHKGNELTRAATPLLRPESQFHRQRGRPRHVQRHMRT